MNQNGKNQLKSQYGLQDSDFDQGTDTETLTSAIVNKTGQDRNEVRQAVEQAQNA